MQFETVSEELLVRFQFIDLCVAAQKNNANINLILNSLEVTGMPNELQESVIKYIQTTPENTNLSILLNIMGLSNEDAEYLLQQYSQWKNSNESENNPQPEDDSSGSDAK